MNWKACSQFIAVPFKGTDDSKTISGFSQTVAKGWRMCCSVRYFVSTNEKGCHKALQYKLSTKPSAYSEQLLFII
jgi:hypothetical protein